MKTKITIFIASLILSMQTLYASNIEKLISVKNVSDKSASILCNGDSNSRIKLKVNNEDYTLLLDKYGNYEYELNNLTPNTKYDISFSEGDCSSNNISIITKSSSKFVISEAFQVSKDSIEASVITDDRIAMVQWYVDDKFYGETFSYYNILDGIKDSCSHKISVKSDKDNLYYDDTVYVTIEK